MSNSGEVGQLLPIPGMTLRDYFAGQALLSIAKYALDADTSIRGRTTTALGKEIHKMDGDGSIDSAARWCYDMANAMLEARADIAEEGVTP